MDIFTTQFDQFKNLCSQRFDVAKLSICLKKYIGNQITAFNPLHIKLLREEVPFERWHFHYKNTTEDPWTQRGWAVFHLCEGALKISLEAIMWCVAKIAEQLFSTTFNHSSLDHEDVLAAQCRGFLLSAYALLSPENAKTGENIGCTIDKFQWGTIYTGERTSYALVSDCYESILITK